MTTVEKQLELKDKILIGLEKVYERLIEFKKQKNSKLVIIKDDKTRRRSRLASDFIKSVSLNTHHS